jgi:hypothetical protein
MDSPIVCTICQQEHASNAYMFENANHNVMKCMAKINEVRCEFHQLCKNVIIEKKFELNEYCNSVPTSAYPEDYTLIHDTFIALLKKCEIIDFLYYEIIVVRGNRLCWLNLFNNNFSSFCKFLDYVQEETDEFIDIFDERMAACRLVNIKHCIVLNTKRVSQAEKKRRFNNETCAICLNELCVENSAMFLCDHCFCVDCVSTHLDSSKTKPTCPLCRTDITSVSLLYNVSRIANISKETVMKSENAKKLAKHCL